MEQSSATSSNLIPAEHVARLSPFGTAWPSSRAATRTAPWFYPGEMRAQSLALGDFLAIDICSTLAMLAAASARQLSAPVAEAATRAALGAISAPGRLPLVPPDHAAMLAARDLLPQASVDSRLPREDVDDGIPF